MLISIIIPVYNVSRYIEECLQSVCSQTLSKNVECIIVDDCSPDNSAALAEAFISDYNGNILFKTLQHKQNKGVSAARNTGLKHASGEYVFFLDADDLLSRNCLKQLYSLTLKHPGIDIIQGNTYCQNPQMAALRIEKQAWFRAYSQDSKWLSRMILTSKIPPCVWNKLILRKLITTNNLYFNEDVVTDEDNLWMFYAAKHIRSMAFCDSLTYNYRINNNGITANRIIDEAHKKQFCLIINDMLSHIDKQRWKVEFLSILKYSYMIELGNEATIHLFKINPIYQNRSFHKLYHHYCRVNLIGKKQLKGLFSYIMFKIYLIYMHKIFR